MKALLLLAVFSTAASLQGCKSDNKGGGGSSGLSMSSDSAACKKAMKCCELRVKQDKGKVTPEDLNLMCSGVAIATTDADCDEFRKGYAASFEEKGVELPADCK